MLEEKYFGNKHRGRYGVWVNESEMPEKQITAYQKACVKEMFQKLNEIDLSDLNLEERTRLIISAYWGNPITAYYEYLKIIEERATRDTKVKFDALYKKSGKGGEK